MSLASVARSAAHAGYGKTVIRLQFCCGLDAHSYLEMKISGRRCTPGGTMLLAWSPLYKGLIRKLSHALISLLTAKRQGAQANMREGKVGAADATSVAAIGQIDTANRGTPEPRRLTRRHQARLPRSPTSSQKRSML
jgi:hypothetical protein